MPLKTVEIEGKQYAEINDAGDVLYTDADGKEIGYNGESLAARLNEVNGESASRRREIKDLNEKLETFKDLDPEEARKALETVKNFDDKKLVDAGEIEKIKQEAIQGTETKYQTLIAEKYEPLEGRLDDMKKKLNNEIIGNLFANSTYIKEELVVPAKMIRDSFGEHVTIEDESVTFRYANGEEVFSKAKPGDKAGFDEAIELLIGASSMRDYLIKGTPGRGGSGGPAPGTGSGDGLGGQKIIKRSDFDKLDAQRKIDLMTKEGFRVVDG